MRTTSGRLALLGGSPVGQVNCPRFPVFSARAVRRVADLLARGGSMGLTRAVPEIRRAEAALSRYHGGREVLAVSSGFAALHAALMGLEIGPGDEVVTTPYTWGASVSCLLAQGAIPVFADVDPVTGLLDPDAIAPLVTRRTRAILVVHLYGQPADMTRILAVARRRGLAVIEDGSQAHGARWRGRLVGNFGHAAGFSCMGGKLLATGEAGYLVTPDPAVYWRACLGTQHMGRSGDEGFPAAYRPFADSLAFTYRVSTVMAVLLEEQLRKLDREVAARRRNAERLRRLLAGSRYLVFPDYGPHAEPAFHMLTMNFDAESAGVSRDTFQAALRAEGMRCFHYVHTPIPSWLRLDWRRYRGPRVPWMDTLRRAGADYSRVRLPGCRHKIDHALEMNWNFFRPAGAAMEQLARIVAKVEGRIDELRRHEKTMRAAPR